MTTISLEKIKLFAAHGIHKEEQIIGGEFEVNLQVVFQENKKIVHIDETINYVSLYEIVINRMKINTPLLETVAMDIIEEIKEFFPQVSECTIKICKTSPPLINFRGHLCISIHKQF